MKKMDPVVHFEMPYEDKDRLVTFYSETFGWNMQPLGAEMGDYVVAETTETDENMMPKTAGIIGGGFYPKAPGIPESPSVVISVEDLDEAMKKVVNGGGTVRMNRWRLPVSGCMLPSPIQKGTGSGCSNRLRCNYYFLSGGSVIVIPAWIIRSRIMSATSNCFIARSSALIS